MAIVLWDDRMQYFYNRLDKIEDMLITLKKMIQEQIQKELGKK